MNLLKKNIINKPWFFVPFVYFVLMLLHASFIGVSDDEAYYWALSKTPSFAYAFHPPAVAWLIGAFQFLFSWIFGENSETLLRMPGILCIALTVALAFHWLYISGADVKKIIKSSFLFFSFAGLFALSWMMVPDSLLFLAMMLLFYVTWKVCFNEPGKSYAFLLAAGAFLAVLSKYSAVLIVFSSMLAVLIWSRKEFKIKSIIALIVGTLLASIPVVVWNASHEWSSILYQIQDRHSGDGAFSLLRYARFWAIETVVLGPVFLIYFLFLFFRLKRSILSRFIAVWVLPSAFIFCVQPGFSDFKPHWVFIVWLPVVLEFLHEYTKGKYIRYALFQKIWGLTLGALVIISCHYPLLAVVADAVGKPLNDIKFDVTNDLYGWDELPGVLENKFRKDYREIPVIGSRYQTASQAAFALGNKTKVSVVPRDLKQKDEWPMLSEVDSYGPVWPELLSQVIFVSDNRYVAPPAFKNARCTVVGEIKKYRQKYLAKIIKVWDCIPIPKIG